MSLRLRPGGSGEQAASGTGTAGGGVAGRRGFGRRRGSAGEVRFDRRQTWLLAVCCVAQFMVILDLSIVNVALPSIQVSLGFTAIGLQWVVAAYAIVFAGFLMLGGRVSDRFGQRRALIAALVLFSAASLAGGAAPDANLLIVARGVQGLGGAMMAAASLAAITSSFPQGQLRHRAIGLWGAMNGAGGAAGTLLGGILTEGLGWRWVLLINPPIGIAAAIAAYLVVQDRRSEVRSKFDLAGALTLTGGLVVLAYGIVNAGALGWASVGTILPLVLGAVLLAAFAYVEMRVAAFPLVPLREVTGQLRVANTIVLLFSAALFPMWYVSSLYLQQVLGLSPLDAGLAFFPMALVIMLAAQRAGRLVGRFGVRKVLACGLTMMATGMLLLARINSSGSAVGYVVFPGLLVAAGIGLSIVPSTIAATQGARAERAGLASGLVNTARQVGGAIGITLLISIATQYSSHLIGDNRMVSQSLTDGFRLAYLIAAGLVLAAALVTVTRLPRPAATAAVASAGPPGQPAAGERAAGEPAVGEPAAGEPAGAPPHRDADPRRLPAGVAARLAGTARRVPLPAAVGVLVACFVGADFAVGSGSGAPIGAYTTADTYHFVSAPSLHPPKISLYEPSGSATAPAYVLLGNFFDISSPPIVGQSGPLMLDSSMQPVWFKPVPTGVVASNLSLQSYRGKPVLAWWQGLVTSTGATESGEDVVVDEHYHTVATLRGKDGWIITMHTLLIEGDDAYVTANKSIPMNLTSYGGAYNGALDDSAVQEYDLSTGKLLKSWNALAHVPLSESYAIPQTNGFPWDAYHVNALQLVGPHTMLVSMRNTWAAYLVDLDTGKVEWTLGGKDSSFSFAPGAAFEWQHDVSLQPDGEVTMFDDHCCEISGAGTYLPATAPSRGLVLHLDMATHVASVVRHYSLGASDDSAYMGSEQILPDGNVFVGWGSLPYFTEFSASGRLLLQATLPGPDLSYRATAISSWVGEPTSPPSARVLVRGGKATVYVSWNGATQVVLWEVRAGDSTSSLKTVATSSRTGFETAIGLPSDARVVEVEALDAEGNVLGRAVAKG